MLGLEKVPVPAVDHTIEVARFTLAPVRVNVGLFSHTSSAGPASTVGAGLMKTKTVSLEGGQPPLAVEVKINGNTPPPISAAVGVYCALSVLAFGVKVPPPPVQLPDPVEVEPARVALGLLKHMLRSEPALAVGAALKDKVIVLETGLQLP